MKQRMRRISALLLVVLMCVSLVVPAFATEEGANCPGENGIHTKSNCSYGEAISVVEAGCGKQGYTVYQCEDCGTYFAADFVESFGDHDWTYLVKDPTCTVDGYFKKVCFNCGEIAESRVDAKLGHVWNGEDCSNVVCDRCGEQGEADDDGHLWGAPVLDKAPTHKTDNSGNIVVTPGKATLTCQNEKCGLTKTVEIYCDAEHVWQEFEGKDATCETTGKTPYKKCTICGKVEKIAGQTSDPNTTIPKTECIAESAWTVTAPTCTEGGKAYHKCKDCGKSMGDEMELEVLGHGYQFKVYDYVIGGKTLAEIATEYEIATGIDTTVEPLKIYVGENAVNITSADTSAETYTWTGEYVDEGEYAYGANCGEYSYIHYNCYRCHATVTTTIEPGHTWVLDEAASEDVTCDANGKNVYVCTNPNCTGKVDKMDGDDVTTGTNVAVKTEILTAPGHDYKDVVTAPTCEEGGYTLSVCKCGKANPEKAEKFDLTEADPSAHVAEENIKTPAGCTTSGTKNTVCALCDEVLSEDETIPATGHSLDLTSVLGETAATCTTPATKSYKCTTCNEVIKREIGAPKGHSLEARVVKPDCTRVGDDRNGYTIAYCKNGCGEKMGEPANIVVFDPNNKDHHLAVHEDESAFVEGDCNTADVRTYVCLACTDLNGVNFTFTVEDTTNNGTGHSLKKIDEVKATCTTTGIRAHKKCEDCGYLTLDGATEVTAEQLVTAKLSETGEHSDVVDIPAVEPVCGVAGNEAGKKCQTCGVIVDPADVVPALQHNYVLLTSYEFHTREANCTEWGYEFHQCTICKAEKIVKYTGDLGGHNEVEYDEVEATCSSTGTTAGVMCDRCGENLSGGETIPAVPHTNEDGATFTTFLGLDGEYHVACNEELEDTSCKFCWTTFTKDHEWAITLVPATCMEYSYELHVCVHCEESKMLNPGFDYAEDHIAWSEWVVEKEATIAADGLKVRTCVCGATEEVLIPALSGLDLGLEVDNAVVSGAELTNSGLLAVTVKTSTKALDVWAIRLTVRYNKDSLVKGDEAKIVNEKFDDVQVAYDDAKGLATIIAYASTDSNEAITLEGEEDLVVLYFRVDANEAVGTTMEFSVVDSIEVITADREAIKVTVPEAVTAAVEATLGYVNSDDTINLTDAHVLMQYITGETEDEDGYCSAADINLDGKISAVDFGLMQQRLLGVIDDAELARAYAATDAE